MHAIAPIALVAGLFAQIGPGPGDPAPGVGRGPRLYVPASEVTVADPTVRSAGGRVDRVLVKRYLRRVSRDVTKRQRLY